MNKIMNNCNNEHSKTEINERTIDKEGRVYKMLEESGYIKALKKLKYLCVAMNEKWQKTNKSK